MRFDYDCMITYTDAKKRARVLATSTRSAGQGETEGTEMIQTKAEDSIAPEHVQSTKRITKVLQERQRYECKSGSGYERRVRMQSKEIDAK
jgi:hypothetical protein